MTPPKAPEDSTADHGNQPSAVSVCAEPPAPQARPVPQPAPLLVLSKRSEFLAAARARRQGTKSMMVQGRKRKEGEAEGIRVGFTCSKKVGNAVARNRAKRRLREAARMVLPQIGHLGWDYVLIGRAEATAARDFEDLKRDLAYAVKKIHG
ncbi:Ribonuclease P protein component [Phaeobacter sp. CECT 5382]|uniref:ribonuclease P protein component n=1 Tax=Rhodobacterales TaxID=204455 RepID=UPI0006D9CF62|nr:ribonuclease P protein component [Phaeobacter sp. CECT 5382]CUH89656.1 Ribonuclease P protein component [Phaeobacter sp. CECT 5382]